MYKPNYAFTRCTFKYDTLKGRTQPGFAVLEKMYNIENLPEGNKNVEHGYPQKRYSESPRSPSRTDKNYFSL